MLKLKSRIAPRGNEDSMKNAFSKDCAMCPPSGIHIVESIASLHDWKVHDADVEAAFLKSGEVTCEVFVKPPTENRMRATHVWRLLVAAY